jgi:murein DD-endopeptidase MepM/ murein hydrolase activator NlpD
MASEILTGSYPSHAETPTVLYKDGTVISHISDLIKSIEWSGDIAQIYRKVQLVINNARATGEKKLVEYKLGEEIWVYNGKTEIFRGFIFQSEMDVDGSQTVTAYDAGIYLAKSKDSFKFVNKKASQIIREICSHFSIRVGVMDDTGYVIPKLIFRDKTPIEMITTALTETRKKTGKRYMPRFEKEYLNIRESKREALKYYVEPGTNVLSSKYALSMEERKDRIKVTGGGTEDSPSKTAYASDMDAVSKRGILQHYVHQSDITDQAKLAQIARQLLNEFNKDEETYDVEALGLYSVISGKSIVAYDTLPAISGYFYVTSDSHKINADGTHTMSLKLSRDLALPEEDYDPPSDPTATKPSTSSTTTKTTTTTSKPSSSSGTKTTTTTTTKVVALTGTNGKANVVSGVRKWESAVRKYANQNGIGGYTELLLAMMMQESGGRYADLMQSSESAGRPRNSLKYEASIAQGVKYYAQTLKKAKYDWKLAMQAYNFGVGFVNYALARGGYTKANAKAFSSAMATKYGWRRYGDVDYVDHVLRYYKAPTVKVTTTTSSSSKSSGFTMIRPAEGRISDTFGTRGGKHFGIDIAKTGTVPIKAAAAGVVTRSYRSSTYGECIFIKHTFGFGSGNGLNYTYETVYAHMRTGTRKFAVGKRVNQGDIIGYMGNTGDSSGQHLHFEVHKKAWNVSKSNAINPLNVIGKKLYEDGSWG